MDLGWLIRKDPRRDVPPPGEPCPVHDSARVPLPAGAGADAAPAAAQDPDAIRFAPTAAALAHRVAARRMSVVRSDLPLDRLDELLGGLLGPAPRCAVLLCTGCDSFVALTSGGGDNAETPARLSRVEAAFLHEHAFHAGPEFVDVLPSIPVRLAGGYGRD